MRFRITQLNEGDYFMFNPADGVNTAFKAVERLNFLRSGLDIPTIDNLDYNTMLGWQMLFAEPHVIECVAIATGDRVSRRLTDGKRFVWRADSADQPVVEFQSDRAKFDAMADELKRKLKDYQKEIEALSKKHKSRKKNAPEELVERTEVLAR